MAACSRWRRQLGSERLNPRPRVAPRDAEQAPREVAPLTQAAKAQERNAREEAPEREHLQTAGSSPRGCGVCCSPLSLRGASERERERGEGERARAPEPRVPGAGAGRVPAAPPEPAGGRALSAPSAGPVLCALRPRGARRCGAGRGPAREEGARRSRAGSGAGPQRRPEAAWGVWGVPRRRPAPAPAGSPAWARGRPGA